MSHRVAVLACLLAACGPRLVWHGKSPDRRHDVRVIEHGGQLVAVDGVPGRAYAAIAPGTLAFSPDGRHLAYAASRGRYWRLVLDGVEGPLTDGIAGVTFSDDGAHVAYAARSAGQWRMIVDGRAGPPFDALLAGSFRFGATGRFAYAAARGGDQHVVTGGVIGPAFRGIAELAFSGDGLHAGYLGRRTTDVVAVVDGVAGPGHDMIDGLVLAPSGGRAAYAARIDGRWHAVVDGVAGPPWHRVHGLVFSDDGAHVAYVGARRRGDPRVIVDGREDPASRGVRPDTLRFAPGATRPTYVVERELRVHVVHDGAEGAVFDDVWPPVFAAGGRGWVYVARLADRWLPVVDGIEGPREARIEDVAISADGRRVAYVAGRGAGVAVIVDGAEHRFDLVVEGTLTFDGEGAHWGCVAGSRAERELAFVVDGARTGRLELEELIDLAIRARAAGLPLAEDQRTVRAWVQAEIARVSS